VTLTCVIATIAGVCGQTPVGIEQIDRAAHADGKAFEYLFQLTDVYGHRLTGSSSYRRAATWVQQTLAALGLENVRFHDATAEGWSEPGWSYERYGVRLLEPAFENLVAIPAPYSPSTGGRRSGEPIFFPLPGRSGIPVDEIMSRFRGRLKDRILIIADELQPVVPPTQLPFRRFTDAELLALREPLPPPPPRPAGAVSAPSSSRSQAEEDADMQKLLRFLRDEGTVAFLAPTRGEGGTALAVGPLARPGLEPPAPPGFNLPAESYNRLVRLMKAGVPVRLEVDLESVFNDTKGHTSVVAEIVGTSKPGEIVLAGAHLDSWHVGTGATDNAANCAVLMEAMRILKTSNLPLARTVRLALWAAEERGVQGSLAYVKEFQRSQRERHYLYFNLDSGGGRIRGLQVQARQEWVPIADRWLTPFRQSGQGYVSIRRSVGSDQFSFEDVGLPTMVFIQDAAFNARTYHSNMDVLDYVSRQDLEDSAAVVAAVLFQAANE
jgi:hypothetical protein